MLVNYLQIIEVPAIRDRILQNTMRDMVNSCKDKLK